MNKFLLNLKNFKKDKIATVRLRLLGGSAKMGAPISPVLGPYGINLNDFCRRFNERTNALLGVELIVEVFIFKDKSFEFNVKNLTVSLLIDTFSINNELDVLGLLKIILIKLHQKEKSVIGFSGEMLQELKVLLGGVLSYKKLKIKI